MQEISIHYFTSPKVFMTFPGLEKEQILKLPDAFPGFLTAGTLAVIFALWRPRCTTANAQRETSNKMSVPPRSRDSFCV